MLPGAPCARRDCWRVAEQREGRHHANALVRATAAPPCVLAIRRWATRTKCSDKSSCRIHKIQWILNMRMRMRRSSCWMLYTKAVRHVLGTLPVHAAPPYAFASDDYDYSRSCLLSRRGKWLRGEREEGEGRGEGGGGKWRAGGEREGGRGKEGGGEVGGSRSEDEEGRGMKSGGRREGPWKGTRHDGAGGREELGAGE